MTAELTTTLASQINATYAEYCGFDDGIRRSVIGKCNKARDLGLLLQSYRSDCAHGNWKLLFKVEGKNTPGCIFPFGYQMAVNFIRYSKANPNPIVLLPDAVNSLKDHMIWSGAIPEPQGHGDQQRATLTWLDRLSLTAGKVSELFNGRVEKIGGDVRSLPDSERSALKMQIKPLVEIYERL